LTKISDIDKDKDSQACGFWKSNLAVLHK